MDGSYIELTDDFRYNRIKEYNLIAALTCNRFPACLAGEENQVERIKLLLGGTGLVLIPLLLTTIPFFCVGAWEGWEVWYIYQTFETAEGEVIGNTLITSQDLDDFTRESSTYHPVVRFYPPFGGSKTFTGGTGTYPAKYEVGEKVTVLYDPANPSDARIRSWEMWFAPILFMVIGLAPILIFGVVIFLIGQKANHEAPKNRSAYHR